MLRYRYTVARLAPMIAVRSDLLEARASGALDELRCRLRSYESNDINKQQQVRLLDGLTDLRLLDILVW
ncbi:hypothetical protein ACFDR8_002911 [Arthrobacter sp. MP_2.3]